MSHERIAPEDCEKAWTHGLFTYCPDCTWTERTHGPIRRDLPEGAIAAARVTVAYTNVRAGIDLQMAISRVAGWGFAMDSPEPGVLACSFYGPFSDTAIDLLRMGLPTLNIVNEETPR